MGEEEQSGVCPRPLHHLWPCLVHFYTNISAGPRKSAGSVDTGSEHLDHQVWFQPVPIDMCIVCIVQSVIGRNFGALKGAGFGEFECRSNGGGELVLQGTERVMEICFSPLSIVQTSERLCHTCSPSHSCGKGRIEWI